MNQLQFIRDTLYELKINYGRPLTLVKVGLKQLDPVTGVISSARISYKLKKVITLDSAVAYALLASAATDGNKSLGKVAKDGKMLVFDKYDLPTNITIAINDEFIIDGRTFMVDKITSVDQKRAYIVNLIKVLGDDLAVSTTESITLTETSSSEIT